VDAAWAARHSTGAEADTACADEERARRTLQCTCDIVEVWRACLRLQPQRDHYSRVHVEVATTSVGAP